jgi:plasmid maintenance system antidote protein VapI
MRQHVLIVDWLTLAGRSQADLARRLGVSTSTVSRTVVGARWLCTAIAVAMYVDIHGATRPDRATSDAGR